MVEHLSGVCEAEFEPQHSIGERGSGEGEREQASTSMLVFGINNRNWGGQFMLKEYLFMTESHSPGWP